MVMHSDVRRKLIRHLIISGNIGLTSAIATLVVTFSQNTKDVVISKFVTIGIVNPTVVCLGLFLI